MASPRKSNLSFKCAWKFGTKLSPKTEPANTPPSRQQTNSAPITKQSQAKPTRQQTQSAPIPIRRPNSNRRAFITTPSPPLPVKKSSTANSAAAGYTIFSLSPNSSQTPTPQPSPKDLESPLLTYHSVSSFRY